MAGTIYVTESPGGGALLNGSSWVDAFTSLQDGLTITWLPMVEVVDYTLQPSNTNGLQITTKLNLLIDQETAEDTFFRQQLSSE